ncbi:unnamed protein product [Darwinula stevensoni]|uniref:Uncharacterized protein n=1 Tax=Darwinula stevensoni TaxID=69355 RepID=A0A7R9FRS4_9CRUS|nr:unnamed protein product [Darwinula stevensoni]CAG0902033.1 unnamed protein product [Darwinula stevensoni]
MYSFNMKQVPFLIFLSQLVTAADEVKEYDLAMKCATNKKVVVELFYNYASAVVLQYQDTGLEIESKDIDCAIEFRSQPDSGIGFVIEDLNLRKTGHRCVDSVRFVPDILLLPDAARDVLHDGSGSVCGTMHNKMQNLSHRYTKSGKAMYALSYTDDRIDFYFRKRRSAVEEKLNLTLTVTAFQRPERWGSCGVHKFDCGHSQCIAKELVCDGHVNCLPRTGYIGLDEEDCVSTQPKDYSIGTVWIVLIIVITSGIVILLFFLCNKFSSRLASHIRPPAPTSDCRYLGTSEFGSNEAPQAVPLHPQEPVLEEADDKPPEYHALFPEGPPSFVIETETSRAETAPQSIVKPWNHVS